VKGPATCWPTDLRPTWASWPLGRNVLVAFYAVGAATNFERFNPDFRASGQGKTCFTFCAYRRVRVYSRADTKTIPSSDQKKISPAISRTSGGRGAQRTSTPSGNHSGIGAEVPSRRYPGRQDNSEKARPSLSPEEEIAAGAAKRSLGEEGGPARCAIPACEFSAGRRGHGYRWASVLRAAGSF